MGWQVIWSESPRVCLGLLDTAVGLILVPGKACLPEASALDHSARVLRGKQGRGQGAGVRLESKDSSQGHPLLVPRFTSLRREREAHPRPRRNLLPQPSQQFRGGWLEAEDSEYLCVQDPSPHLPFTCSGRMDAAGTVCVSMSVGRRVNPRRPKCI